MLSILSLGVCFGCDPAPEKLSNPDWLKQDLSSASVTLELMNPEGSVPGGPSGLKPIEGSKHAVDSAWVKRLQTMVATSSREGELKCMFHADVVVQIQSRPPLEMRFCFGCGEIQFRPSGSSSVQRRVMNSKADFRRLFREQYPKDSRFEVPG